MLPKNRQPTHPGAILKEQYLEPMGLTQTELAIHLRWTYSKINEIINAKRGITYETALSFADIFKTTPDLWLNLQKNYDLWKAQKKHIKKKALIAS
ncbi:MAG: HigA family addiction module antidote protein [Spirochaetes bacterium]|nr:HigA family addiction module antidote protein [Spirochaetota bacterium]